MPSLMSVVTALGWVGAVAGILAYAMVSRGRWSADSLAFQLTNLAGASMMLLVAAVNGVWPSAAANMAWLVIGGSALAALLRARTRTRATEAVEPDPGQAAVSRPADARPAVGHRVLADAA